MEHSSPVLQIRAVQPGDIPQLEEWFPEGGPARHGQRLARQEMDTVVYLFAWLDGDPVGHLLLKWLGCEDKAVMAHLPVLCPDIEDLFVFRSVRRQGIATRLLSSAEQLVRQRGGKRLGISVGVDNQPAQILYHKLGFHNSGIPPYTIHGVYTDRLGQEQSWSERCVYLIKDFHV